MAGVVVVSAVLVLGSAACGDPEVRRTDVSARDRAACAALVKALPDSVADQDRRGTGGDGLGAAWGDPPIVLTCGVPKPADYDPFAGCDRIDGVGWFAPAEDTADQTRDAVLTTIDREPRVEIRLPAEYRPPLAALVDVADAVKAHTRETSPCA